MKETLAALQAGLDEARARLVGQARPAAEVLDAAVAEMGKAENELASSIERGAAADLNEQDRLDIIRTAREIRGQLKVVGRLVSGSARFASLIKDAKGTGKPAQDYGPDGGARDGPPSGTYERTV